MYLYPMTETIAAEAPIAIAPPGPSIMLPIAPTATPPDEAQMVFKAFFKDEKKLTKARERKRERKKERKKEKKK